MSANDKTDQNLPPPFASADDYLHQFAKAEKDKEFRLDRAEAPLEVWLEIIAGVPNVRVRAAMNKTLPEVVVEKLAQDPAKVVRASLARNRRIAQFPNPLERLLADEEELVRKSLALNGDLPPEFIQRLTQDESQLVSDSARKNLSLRKAPNPRDIHTQAPITSVEEYLSLVEVYDRDRLARARWAEASVEIWLDLIYRSPETKWSVALHKRLPYEVLKVLTNDPDEEIRDEIAGHAWINQFPDLVEQLSRDEGASVRLSIAGWLKTPVEVVERLTLDPDADVAKRAARNLEVRADAVKRGIKPSWRNLPGDRNWIDFPICDESDPEED